MGGCASSFLTRAEQRSQLLLLALAQSRYLRVAAHRALGLPLDALYSHLERTIDSPPTVVRPEEVVTMGGRVPNPSYNALPERLQGQPCRQQCDLVDVHAKAWDSR